MKICVEWVTKEKGVIIWHMKPWWSEFCEYLETIEEVNQKLAPLGARYEEDDNAEGWVIATDEKLFTAFVLRWT